MQAVSHVLHAAFQGAVGQLSANLAFQLSKLVVEDVMDIGKASAGRDASHPRTASRAPAGSAKAQSAASTAERGALCVRLLAQAVVQHDDAITATIMLKVHLVLLEKMEGS